MKKIILFLIFFNVSAFGQVKSKEERQAIIDKKKALAKYEPRDSLNYPTKFCLLMATGKFLSKEVDISIDYGQDSSLFEDTRIRDKNGKIINFNSVIDALNYMESLGWEFVNAYAITVGNQNVYHYLLKAKDNISDNFIPKTKKDFITKKE
jgi:hypothetical protein